MVDMPPAIPTRKQDGYVYGEDITPTPQDQDLSRDQYVTKNTFPIHCHLQYLWRRSRRTTNTDTGSSPYTVAKRQEKKVEGENHDSADNHDYDDELAPISILQESMIHSQSAAESS
jgi:hypothetical protein